MSLELYVILATGSAPDAAAWNRSLAEAHLPTQFVELVDLSRHTGFLPVTLRGEKSGFEFMFEPYSELAAHYPTMAKLKMDKPIVYSFSYGGHFDECASVFYSASVLVSRFGGTAFDPQGGVVMSSKELLDAAKQCLDLVHE